MTEQRINLPLDSIQADTRAQSRAEIDMVVVGEYADDMKAGAVFPPLVVFYDQSTYWLAEGFHRYHAYRQAEITTVPAFIKAGGLREAILQSLGSNADHGKRRSNADKRRAVEMMLKDAEWGKWNNCEIGRRCAVSSEFVRQIRPAHLQPLEVTYTTKHGTTATMQTGNIGKKAEPAPAVVETLPLPVPVAVPTSPVFWGDPDDAEPELPIAAEPDQRPCLVEPDISEEGLIDAFHESLQQESDEEDEDDQDDYVPLVRETFVLPTFPLSSQLADPAYQAPPFANYPPLAPVIPVAPPPVSTADPRQLGYIGTATPVAERDSNDWHTPAKYIEAVKSVMGWIDLDPFSSAKANETVQAARVFTVADDALGDTPWNAGTLFMNPPYGRGAIDAAINRFLTEWIQRHFQEAIVLVNNATETQWFQSLMMECSAICFTDHRIAFNSPDNKQESGNTRGQAFFYFGHRFGPFNDAFHGFGAIVQVIA